MIAAPRVRLHDLSRAFRYGKMDNALILIAAMTGVSGVVLKLARVDTSARWHGRGRRRNIG